MKIEVFNLWNNLDTKSPTIVAYIPENKLSDGAVVILPGGGYQGLSPQEGKDYAEFFAKNGMCAFVCYYRVYPNVFPVPLLDARRAMKFVRYNAKKYDIDKNKVAIMGSSAGGHLAALTSTYFEKIDCESVDDIENEDFIPNAQILCYPVIKLSVDTKIADIGSCVHFLGVDNLNLAHSLTPEYIVSDKTPPCFIFHTLEDETVPIINSLDYIKALKENGVSCEFHMFPNGRHGIGLAPEKDDVSCHVSQWNKLVLNWLKYIGF